jgi:hypothetical protein
LPGTALDVRFPAGAFPLRFEAPERAAPARLPLFSEATFFALARVLDAAFEAGAFAAALPARVFLASALAVFLAGRFFAGAFVLAAFRPPLEADGRARLVPALRRAVRASASAMSNPS